ncbi:hypothetical protein [Chryseobacterium sp. GP-SGM7]|uniref:hypothetical protein n=1 Tax=Chryseobacterium sp. GP-SGM7 TaxID=3411323 RepID=UPI003B92A66B
MKLNIPQPCHENWDAMTSDQKGKFCQVCNKSVRDFTHCSDEEIYEEIKSNFNICGNFKDDQLNRNIALSVFGRFALGLVASVSFSNTIDAQELKTDEEIKKIDLKKGFSGFRKVNDTIGLSGWLGMPSKEDIESTQPKIFLDGFRISEDKMKKLNQENIESVKVLDEKSARAIYGDNARFGAVVITSKKKKKSKN